MGTRKSTVSVAMCTFNGESFLRDQLESIARQSRLPDELVVCDDKSLDGTIRILEEFSSSVSFPVRIFENQENLGSTKNFEKALCLCEGDIVAFSDQDDVWYQEKLQLMEERFTSYPNAGVVFSDGVVVNEKLSSLGYSLWETFPFDKKCVSEGKAFEVLLNHNVVTGATMAIRSRYREAVCPFSPVWVHDAWIVILLSMISEIHLIEKCLIEYRQHDSQQIGGKRKTVSAQLEMSLSVKGYESDVIQLYKLLAHIEKKLPLLDPRFTLMIRRKISHLKKRQGIYEGSVMLGIVKCFRELLCGRYHCFSNGFRSFLKDVLFSIGVHK